jgi:membrane-associated phospholipid phosphatase
VSRIQWWPVDRLILGYYGTTALVELIYFTKIPDAGKILAVKLAAVAVLLAALRFPGRAWSHVFRHWYPLPYVAACYKEMALMIPAIRSWTADATLSAADHALWGTHPTVWLERLSNPIFAEFIQVIYALFVPVVLAPAVLLWRRGRLDEFRRFAFLISIGYLASYAGYVLMPARGPRFFESGLYSQPLQGVWLFDGLRGLLDALESAHYDCFPSGHTELTLLACAAARRVSSRLFIALAVFTAGVIVATVYLRYHYTVDLAAGAALAWVLWKTSPRLYKQMGGETQ